MTRVSILVAASLIGVFTRPAIAAPAAEIVSLEGKGEFREAQRTDWNPATLKQSLFPTNFVRTGDLSRMAILFPDRTQLRLAPNSTLQIKEAAQGPDTRTILNLNSGRSWVQSKVAPRGLTMETPSALAAIRGTDWEMAVDDQGRATLSVFSGEVEFYNEQGNVTVRPNEQALAEKGKAPVKLALRVSRTRVQWVSSYTVDPMRYAEMRAGTSGAENATARMVREGQLAQAYEALRREAQGANAQPVTLLLLADFEIYRGELPAARAVLERGARAYPGDERFAAQLARVALYDDDRAKALELARAAVARKPDSLDALIVLGDIERIEGHAREASIAYGHAMQVASQDARGWEGLGIVESERENVRRARGLLERAITLDESQPGYHAELGTLESFAGNLPRARAALERAIAIKPDHYVAWTGLGILALKAGDTAAALDALLRATLIEPRYARAHLYLAAAYYAQERSSAALASLQRAAELDPQDPLPYLLSSIIYLDRIEPVAAAAQAREALVRIPFLKSVNQVADNQKGVANVGSALAELGLESWSRSMANEAYLPFWGGSHLFLADRYPGDFNRRSELMQGFITDPLAFGASNRFQSLFAAPGLHGTVSMRYAQSDDLRVYEPTLTLNGYVTSPTPTSYFFEDIETRVDPRNAPLDMRARTLTAALGFRPMHELSGFVYVNRLTIDADLGLKDETGQFQHVIGANTRLDGGLRYAPNADASWWLKAGAGRENSSLDETLSVSLPGDPIVSLSHFTTRPSARDLGLRGTIRGAEGLEYTVGAERSHADTPKQLGQDSTAHFASSPVPQQFLEQSEGDRTYGAFAFGRYKDEGASFEGGFGWHDYHKDRSFHFVGTSTVDLQEDFRRRGLDPALGFTLRPSSAMLSRAACRRWLKPNALDTLVPVAIAGIPLDDQLVLPGGTLAQCQAQLEWTLAPNVFATADVARVEVRNLVSPFDGVLNTRVDVTNLDRLRNRTLTQPGKPDQLEDVPVYSEGSLRRFHAAVEAIVAPRVSARLHYTYSESENTSEANRGNRIPYIARHDVNVGLTWSPGWRVFVTTIAAYRSRRYSDELNTALLPAGWDAQVTLFVESPDKRWALEAFGANLLKKEVSDTFGVVASYRF